MKLTILMVALLSLTSFGLIVYQSGVGEVEGAVPMSKSPDAERIPASAKKATFGAGCFWCVEEVFQQIDGVYSVTSGYMGGEASDAYYKAVSSGRTDHVEVVHIHYNEDEVSFEKLLDVLFKAHDPTQLNRQGPDVGRHYRSVVFYHDDLQKLAAETKIKELTEAAVFGKKRIVTEVTAAKEFYSAEAYHQDFARHNPRHGYLRRQLYPKLRKLGLNIPE